MDNLEQMKQREQEWEYHKPDVQKQLQQFNEAFMNIDEEKRLELSEDGSYKGLMRTIENQTVKQSQYKRFQWGLMPLPPMQAQNEEQVPENKVSQKKQKRQQKKDKKAAVKEYEKEKKRQSADPQLVKEEDVQKLKVFQTKENWNQWAKEKLPHSEQTRGETLKKIVEEGDYSNFENLDSVMRNLIATRELKKFRYVYQINEKSDPAEVCAKIKERGKVSALLNPALRLGLSLAKRNKMLEKERKNPEIEDWFSDFCEQLDEEMSTDVMVETLTHRPDFETVKTYFKEKNLSDAEAAQKANEAIAANQAQQIQIAKRLLLMQLSNFKKIEGDQETAWDHSMAAALSHCSRVVLTLPKVDNSKRNARQNQNAAKIHHKMWRSILTIHGENTAQDNARGSSTHSLERREVNKDANKFHKSQEKKVLFNFTGQRGMNCAIGGLGNAGVSGKTICNDGSCGHFYSMYMEGDETHYGAMLMGLESDAYGVTNQMGHTHDIHATGEKASSLGGQRTDEIGNKYGGRQCDLSSLSAQDINAWLSALERKMQDPDWWQEQGNAVGDIGGMDLMKLLAGKKENWTRSVGAIRRCLGVSSAQCCWR